MKTFLGSLAAAALLAASAAQAQAPVTADSPLLAQLQAIQTTNSAFIEKQKKTLEALDAMKEAAEQIKTLGKRG